MTRREERAGEIREAGAEAVVCDVFDAEALREAVVAARPEVVIHALTALPPKFDPKTDYLAATNRVRTEGTRNLVAAARAAGARRIVAESVAFFYEPEGDWVKDEKASLLPIGVLSVEGAFDKGDVVEIRDGSGRVHGRGLVNYAADACRKLAGRHSDDIDAILGWRGYDALITRDNLVMGAV